jgi:hypothetical protein
MDIFPGDLENVHRRPPTEESDGPPSCCRRGSPIEPTLATCAGLTHQAQVR